jgi:hypothetical protein
MPRISRFDRPSPAWLEKDRFGTERVRSAKLVMWAARICAPLRTVTLSGTLRTFSERFCEVTVISSIFPDLPEAGAVCDRAGEASPVASRTASRTPRQSRPIKFKLHR